MRASFSDPKFLDKAAVEEETRRVFDICHGCRLCFNLCPSFPHLFDRVDEEGDKEVDGLTEKDADRVADLCYQCKICDVKCPYTPPHKYELNFPLLMLRRKAVRAKEKGVPLNDRVLGSPQKMGKLGSFFAPFSNWALKIPGARFFQEKITGVHRARKLPKFFRKTFRKRFKKTYPSIAPKDPVDQVVLFSSCSIDYHNPQIGDAALKVLATSANVSVTMVNEQCCGMPALDAGDIDKARGLAEQNLKELLPHVREGKTIVSPGPTCTYVLKNELPDLIPTDEAREVAAATKDLAEYLVGLKKGGKWEPQLEEKDCKVACHVPCHLKAQNIGFKSRDLLKMIPGAKVETVEKCSGVDGTWGFKTEYYDLSLKEGKKLCGKMEGCSADTWTSDCALAAMQVDQVSGTKPKHPIEIFAEQLKEKKG